MHDARRIHKFHAERLPDRLMSEADAEQRDSGGGGLADQLRHDAGAGRAARPRGEHDRLRTQRERVSGRKRIVAAYLHLRAELLEILDEIVGERIEIVNHQNHDITSQSSRPAAASRIDFSMAAALLQVS